MLSHDPTQVWRASLCTTSSIYWSKAVGVQPTRHFIIVLLPAHPANLARRGRDRTCYHSANAVRTRTLYHTRRIQDGAVWDSNPASLLVGLPHSDGSRHQILDEVGGESNSNEAQKEVYSLGCKRLSAKPTSPQSFLAFSINRSSCPHIFKPLQTRRRLARV